MHSNDPVFLFPTSERAVTALAAWREEYFRCLDVFVKFRDEIGARNVYSFGVDKPSSFSFPNNVVPDGWVAPRKGRTRPKKSNVEMIARIDALPWPENFGDFVRREFDLPTSVWQEDHNSPEYSGFVRLYHGSFSDFDPVWACREDGTPGEVIIRAPNYPDISERSGGDPRWGDGATLDALSEFRAMSRAELELMFAQANVDRERYLKENAPEPAAP